MLRASALKKLRYPRSGRGSYVHVEGRGMGLAPVRCLRVSPHTSQRRAGVAPHTILLKGARAQVMSLMCAKAISNEQRSAHDSSLGFGAPERLRRRTCTPSSSIGMDIP